MYIYIYIYIYICIYIYTYKQDLCNKSTWTVNSPSDFVYIYTYISRKILLLRPPHISPPPPRIYAPQIRNPINILNIEYKPPPTPLPPYIAQPSPEYTPIKFVKSTKYQVY